MMLGRIFTGRLPTTQANLDLINSRIRKVQTDMTILDNKVRAGQIDSRQAAYQRQQLIGEVDELRRVIANSRLSTPSYKTPSDIRTGKPAKKYIPDSQLRITERDARLPVRSIPSNWQATELTELDVPNIPAQAAARNRWPSHWPGNHSPMIMQAIMQTGEVNGKQLIDPRSKDMKLRLNMVGSLQDMNTAIMVKARFQQLYKTMEASPAFTNGDRTLVNIVIGKINRQITFAEQEIEKRRMTKPDPTKAFEKAKMTKMPNPYPGQSDTSSGDRAPPVPIAPPAPSRPTPSRPALPSQPKPTLPSPPPSARLSIPKASSPSARFSRPKAPSFRQPTARTFNPTMARRTGTTMALGALQSHDRYKHLDAADRKISRTQRQSYLTTERELALAKKRAGARIDVTKEIKNQPVTRPWSMQVSAPTQEVEQLHIMLDSSLQSIGITQGMLTQQAHNYIAAIVNSLDSSMNPTERTEFVVEKIMSEMVNRSALLRDDVRVDVRQNGWPPVNIAPADTTSVDGLGSAFLKTKAAMGRLLG